MTRISCITLGAVLLAALGASDVYAADAQSTALRDRTIAYAVTGAHWAIYQTKDAKEECPDGVNEYGPREIFSAMFPDLGSVEETQLARESAVWFPMDKDETFPFHVGKAKTGIGMNLDGKVDADDLTSPDGVRGIDNQLGRALSCVRFFRGPDGIGYHFTDVYVRQNDYNRAMIELTNVDSLINDDDVDVAVYRGLDPLMADATGAKIVPGGLQRVDTKFGKKFQAKLKGKIVNGVLTTAPKDIYWPFAWFGGVPGQQHFRDFRFNLKLTEEGATGLTGGYTDVDTWYYSLARGRSTHHQSYGTMSAPGLYQAMRRLADAYPDKDGTMTAISWALDLPMVQVFIEHPGEQTADGASGAR
jgi:hypothetical protein